MIKPILLVKNQDFIQLPSGGFDTTARPLLADTGILHAVGPSE
jgi:hypothetical protein